MKTIEHDPQANLDYVWDWSEWLAFGEVILSQTVTSSIGVTVGAVTEANGRVTAWVSGGVAGRTYDVVCHIVTNSGREDDRTILLECAER